MVRLVFRPYTQFRRSICTSESLRTSIRVSPDFVLTRHSSPSFGSQRVRSWCASSRNENETPRECGSFQKKWPSSLRPRKADFHFHCAFRFSVIPMTRAHAGLLGPCFKTGPESTQSYSVADRRFNKACSRTPRRTAVSGQDRHQVRSLTCDDELAAGRTRTDAATLRHLWTVERAGRATASPRATANRHFRSPLRTVDRHPTDRDVLLGEKCTRPKATPDKKDADSANASVIPTRQANCSVREWISPFELSGFSGLPLNGFTYSWTLSSKFFSTFPHGTCSLSVSWSYLALDGVYHPLRAALSSNPTLRRDPLESRNGRYGPGTLYGQWPRSRWTWTRRKLSR